MCAAIQDGAHESPAHQFDGPGKDRFLYVTSKNIRNNHLDLGNVSYVGKEFHDRIYPRCKPSIGDVLLTKDGANTGNVTLNTLDEPFSLLSSVCLIKTMPHVLQPAFLSYYIQSPQGLQSITGQMTGAAIKRIILRDIKLAEIPLPPLPEQQRIVALLDEAFASLAIAKANAEGNARNARALFESHLQAVFTQRGNGWVDQSLISLCELFVDSAHRTPEYQAEGIPALRPRDIVNGTLNLARALRVSKAESDIQSKRYEPRPGDIVYSRELSYGWAAALPQSPRVCLSQGMCLFRPIAQVNADFLIYVLNGPIGRGQAAQAAVGAAHPHINLSDIKSYVIPVPPLREQERITFRLDGLIAETTRLARIHESKLGSLEALRSALLREAFLGKLT